MSNCKVEIMMCWEDRTWTTEFFEVPGEIFGNDVVAIDYLEKTGAFEFSTLVQTSVYSWVSIEDEE
jgi:hypothetical protein